MSCCDSSTPCGVGKSLEYHTAVREYYGTELQSQADLKTTACTAEPPPVHVRRIIEKVPQAVLERFYGCGSPLPQGIVGKSLLDLGCGAGRDCYVAAALVGPRGRVVGVDMTEQMLQVARDNFKQYSDNMQASGTAVCGDVRFVLGKIEEVWEAGVPFESVDVTISNCVVNLSPNKAAVLHSVHKVLKSGGEMYFSDVYVDRRLPEAAKNDRVAVGECLGGASYWRDFVSLCKQTGFADPRVLKATSMHVNESMSDLLGGARFASVTYRLFKLPALEETREDYGETATYHGTIEGSEELYVADWETTLMKGVATPVDSNLAAILREGWLAPHFTVSSRTQHRGPFQPPCTQTLTAVFQAAALPASGAADCGTSCCPPSGGTMQCCAPPPKASACCGPPSAGSSCCPPTSKPAGGCCPPTSGGCCPPLGQSGGACCPPAGQSGGGCCGAKAAMPKVEEMD